MFRRLLQEMQHQMLGQAPFDDIMGSLKDIQKELENKKIANQLGSIDWSFISLHLGEMDILKRNSDYFHDVFFYMARLFDVYQCRNHSVIADAFQMECFIFEYSSNSFRRAKEMANRLRENLSCCEIEGLNFVARLMKMPYTSSDSSYSLMYDVIQMYLISVEDKVLKHLLEYGVMYIRLSDHRSTWAHCHERMSDLMADEDKPLLLNSRRFLANVKELTPETRQRMLAVSRGIEVILRARVPGNSEIEFGLCFRMACETIPEPIVICREIAAFLNLALAGPSVDTVIGAIQRDYEKLFPESCEPLSPRPLKFLSRCQVKQNLRQAGNFPYGALDLEIPTAVKNYIRSVETDYMWEQYNSYRK